MPQLGRGHDVGGIGEAALPDVAAGEAAGRRGRPRARRGGAAWRGSPAPPGAPTSRCAWPAPRAPGARVASSVAVSRSSEMPAAYLPSTLAVAGATITRSALWPRRVCGIGSGRTVEQRRAGGLRRQRRERERADEPQRAGGEHRRRRARRRRPGGGRPRRPCRRRCRRSRRGRCASLAPRSGLCAFACDPASDGGLGGRRPPAAAASAAAISASSSSVGSGHRLDLADLDLLHRDRERLARHRGDLRRHDLAEALAELVVVVVDLPGPHRRQRDQRELGVDPLEQVLPCGGS